MRYKKFKNGLLFSRIFYTFASAFARPHDV